MKFRSLAIILLSLLAFKPAVGLCKPKKQHKIKEILVIGTRDKAGPDLPVEHRVITNQQVFQTQPASLARAGRGALNPVIVGSPGFTTFEINGFSGRRVVLLEDGLRVDTQRSIGPTGAFMPLFDISRIQVIKGPASLVYGSGGMGGAVNVIYTNPWKKQGLHGAAGTHFHTNNTLAGMWARSRLTQKHWFIKAYAGYDHASDYDSGANKVLFSSFKNLLAGGSLGWRPNQHHTVKIRFESAIGRDQGKPATVLDMKRHRFTVFPKDDNLRGTLKYVFKKRQTRVVTAVSYNRTQRDFRVQSATNQIYGTKHFSSNQVSAMARVNQKLTKNQILTIGTDLFYADLYLSKAQKGHTKTLLHGDHQVLTGLFLMDRFRPSNRLTLIAGIRYDMGFTATTENSTTKTAVSGTLGWRYRILPLLQLRMAYGRTFRLPTIKEVSAKLPTPIGMFCGNPGLKPEQAHEVSMGVEGSNKWLEYHINVFNTLATNLITLSTCKDPDCDYTYKNIGSANIFGVEARISGKIPMPGSMRLIPALDMAYEYGRNPATDGAVPMIPPFRINGALYLKGRNPWRSLKWSVGAGMMRSFSQSRIVQGMEAATWQTGPTPAYTLYWAQMAAGLDGLGARIEFLIRAENLLNTAYRDHLSANPGFGRDIKFAVRTLF